MYKCTLIVQVFSRPSVLGRIKFIWKVVRWKLECKDLIRLENRMGVSIVVWTCDFTPVSICIRLFPQTEFREIHRFWLVGHYYYENHFDFWILSLRCFSLENDILQFRVMIFNWQLSINQNKLNWVSHLRAYIEILCSMAA